MDQSDHSFVIVAPSYPIKIILGRDFFGVIQGFFSCPGALDGT